MNEINEALKDRDAAKLAKLPEVPKAIKAAAKNVMRWTGTSNRSALSKAVGTLEAARACRMEAAV